MHSENSHRKVSKSGEVLFDSWWVDAYQLLHSSLSPLNLVPHKVLPTLHCRFLLISLYTNTLIQDIFVWIMEPSAPNGTFISSPLHIIIHKYQKRSNPWLLLLEYKPFYHLPRSFNFFLVMFLLQPWANSLAAHTLFSSFFPRVSDKIFLFVY